MVRLHIRQEQLDSSLILSIKQKDTRLAISLLNQGADANAQDITRFALTWQTIVPYFRELFNSKGINPSIHHNSALSLYCKLLEISQGENDHEFQEHVSVINAFLDHGANPNVQDDYCRTPLHYAPCNTDAAITRRLLEYHADPNIRDYCGITPLCWASLASAGVLIEYGADVNSRANDGLTPLMYHSSGVSDLGTMKILIEHGASINAFSNTHGTAAHYAVIFGQLKSLELLYEHQARLDLCDNYGDTLLISSVYVGLNKVDTVKWLLKHGARLDTKSNSGMTALDYAISRGDTELIHLLKSDRYHSHHHH